MFHVIIAHRSTLGHGKDVDDPHSVVIHKLAQHQTHDLHGNSGTTYEMWQNRTTVKAASLSEKSKETSPISTQVTFATAKFCNV